jgi:hypothetical protein
MVYQGGYVRSQAMCTSNEEGIRNIEDIGDQQSGQIHVRSGSQRGTLFVDNCKYN